MLSKNGHYANGRQRWFCPACRRSFSWHYAGSRHKRKQDWFRQWIAEGYSVRQLAAQSGFSSRKLYGLIASRLAQTPSQFALDASHSHLVFDGTYLHRPNSLVALMDAQTHRVIRGQYGVSESSQPQIMEFFERLALDGLQPLSFTVDGNSNVIRVVRSLWPDAKVQRCLVHIQRQGLAWCRRDPKTTYARRLRDIFLNVSQIRTLSDRDKFLELVTAWEDHYGSRIRSRSESGQVFSEIKRARSMLFRALPDMFFYLGDPNIPSSTNGLEGYFSRLKARYRQHRGLSTNNRYQYFTWYFYLVPR